MPKKAGPKSMAEAWDDYRVVVLPRNAGPTQVLECRRAFYAGAESLLMTIMGGLEDGPDATPADEAYLMSLHMELIAFAHDVTKGRA